MRTALASHDRLLGEVISAAGGHVVKSTGDGVFAVFGRAHQAMEAAVGAQQRFRLEEFDEVGRLRVRMAIHTGEAEERRGDYFGSALNRAARLLAAGHGGQVLVSAATREVLGDAGFGFVDLGEHRLPDLARPEHVYQLEHRNLPAEFPPLISLDVHPNNLPVQLTSFIGRDREVLEVSKAITEARLVTLTGVGGTGKTRLSLQVAAEVAGSYPDGVWLVELAPVADPRLVVSQAAEPFGVRDMKTGRPLVEILTDFLADKELLLLLDNCEHLVEPSGALVESLLTRCPLLRIIATSRELLGVQGEVVYPVPPLGIQGSGAAVIEEDEAVRLFEDRACHVLPRFRLNTDNLATVREITRRLDGLPLAIELAASRANLLTPDQLLQRLDDQLRVITSGRRDRGRHRTLEAAMDWSYDLLSPQEQSLFRQLAAFAGGWSLEAAEAVCRVPGADPLALLGRLVDQSLVSVSDISGTNRYRFLEPVRQYALVKLSDSGEEEPARQCHADYFVDLTEASDQGLRGHEQDDWARRIEADHDNVRSAIDWALDAGRDDVALRLTAATGWFWWVRGYWRESQEWFHRVYEATPDADPVLRGRVTYKVAGLEIQRARPTEVVPLLEQILAVVEEHGTDTDVAWVIVQLADASPDPERGIELAAESRRRFSAVGDAWGEAYASMTLGFNLWGESQSEASVRMREAIETLSTLGDRWTAGWFGFNFGYLLALGGRYEEGRRVIEEVLETVTGTYDRWVTAHCLSRLAAVATMTGDHEEAERLFKEALPVHRQIGDESCTSLVQTYLGEVYCDQGQVAEARRHLAAGMAGFRELNNPPGVANGLRRALRDSAEGIISEHDRQRTTEAVQAIKKAVGSGPFEEWWASGTGMSMDEAVNHALGV
jgi:predicted ATPase